MSEIDYTLRDYRYPNEGYDGCETFAGVLRTFFPRWCADGKAAGLPKSWLPATAEEYAMHYLDRILHAHTYGVYPEEIDGLKRDYEKLWGEVSKVLRELSELVAK